jgi:hypothetical protein
VRSARKAQMQTKLSNVEVAIDLRANRLAQVSEAARALAATHVPKQFRDGNSRSCLEATPLIDRAQLVPERDRWLDPIMSPARSWQFRSKSTVAAVVGLVGLMAAVAIGDVIPIGQFPSFDLWRQIASDRKELASRSAPRVSALSSVSAEPAIARVIVQASREKSGNPTRLGLTLQGQPEGAVVTITGLVSGMELSNGEPFGATAWRLRATDLGDIWIGPPDNFVGSVDLDVELRSPDDRVIDRQAVHLEWLP